MRKLEKARTIIATKALSIATSVLLVVGCNRIPKEPKAIGEDKHVVKLEILDANKLSSTVLIAKSITMVTPKIAVTKTFFVPAAYVKDVYVCAESPDKTPVVLLEKSNSYKPGDRIEAYVPSKSDYERRKEKGNTIRKWHVSKINGKFTPQLQFDSAHLELYAKYKAVFQERAVSNANNKKYKEARKEYMKQRSELKSRYKAR
jgi:hypothetical protein